MSFEVVKIGACKRLFNDGRRIHFESRKIEATRRKE